MSLFSEYDKPLNPQMTEGVDYYEEKGYRVLTEKFLTERGYCCGNACRHCPYFPENTKGSTELKE
ncbi:MAG: DUF5522 domain-containing protein [Bacteroidales bacterium]